MVRECNILGSGVSRRDIALKTYFSGSHGMKVMPWSPVLLPLPWNPPIGTTSIVSPTPFVRRREGQGSQRISSTFASYFRSTSHLEVVLLQLEPMA